MKLTPQNLVLGVSFLSRPWNRRRVPKRYATRQELAFGASERLDFESKPVECNFITVLSSKSGQVGVCRITFMGNMGRKDAGIRAQHALRAHPVCVLNDLMRAEMVTEAPAAPTNSICAPAQLETLVASVPFRTFDRAPQHANVPFFTPTDLSDSKLLSSWHCLAPQLAGT